MTLKVTQGHRDNRYSIGHVLLPIVVCNNNTSILHRFRDITTFAVYVTTFHLKKSFSFKFTVEIIGHMRFSIHVKTHLS